MKQILLLVIVALLAWWGYSYYQQHKVAVDAAMTNANTTANTVVNVATTKADDAVASAIKSVSPISLLYYTNNRNYGTSAAHTICNDTSSSTSIGAIISDIQIYTKSISCAVDTNFPAKSFTLVAPSVAHAGSYYCTDQNGGESLIASVAKGSGFKEGLSCK